MFEALVVLVEGDDIGDGFFISNSRWASKPSDYRVNGTGLS
jgi:hypothetical protein